MSLFRQTLSVGLVFAFLMLPAAMPPAQAQWGPGTIPTDRSTQANAVNAVRAQIGWLQNAARNASSRNADPAGTVWQKLDAVRAAYSALTMTLRADQAAIGANELAELAAGLEAFANYQSDIRQGRSDTAALQDLCQVLKQATNVWLQQFNKVCRNLRIGS